MGITRSKPEEVVKNRRQAEAGTDPYIYKEPTIRKVSIAIAQMACSTDRTDNILHAGELVREAATKGAQVVLLQELFETPYFCIEKSDAHFAEARSTKDNPAIKAMQELPDEKKPKQVLGCEVWRDLDWMPDQDKVLLDVSDRENLANALVSIFDSQITGGKRYDRAAVGRRYANATFFHADGRDKSEQLTFAMDLTPVIYDQSIKLCDYVMEYLDKFKSEVKTNIEHFFK